MRSYDLTANVSGQNVQVTWKTDIPATSILYLTGPSGQQTFSSASGFYHSKALTSSDLTADTTYSYYVISQYGEGISISPTYTFTTTTSATTATFVDTRQSYEPYCTDTGDVAASTLPPWMAMGKVPGVACYTMEVIAETPYLRVDPSTPDTEMRLAVGSLLTPSGDTSTIYTISSQSNGIPLTVSHTAGSQILTRESQSALLLAEDTDATCFSDTHPELKTTLAEPPWTLTFHGTGTNGQKEVPLTRAGTLALTDALALVSPGDVCVADETKSYTVDTVGASSITFTEALNSAYTTFVFTKFILIVADTLWPEETDATWWFMVPSVSVDREVTETAETQWVVSSLGRRLIESVARKEDQFNTILSYHWNPFGLGVLSTGLPWFGHFCQVPINIPQGTPLLCNRIGNTLKSTGLLITEVSDAIDLETTPYPCYTSDGTNIVFVHLQMVEESLAIASNTFTTSYPIVPGTPIYVEKTGLEFGYGFQRIDPEMYALDETLTEVTLISPVTDVTIAVRYDAAYTAEAPYTNYVGVVINSTQVTTQVTQLWNAFDSIGQLLGLPRRKLQNGAVNFEPNDTYKERLLCWAFAPKDLTLERCALRTDIRLGESTLTWWDTETTPILTLDATQTQAYIKSMPKVNTIINDPGKLLTSGDLTTTQNCLGDPVATENGFPVLLTFSTDIEEDLTITDGAVTLSATPIANTLFEYHDAKTGSWSLLPEESYTLATKALSSPIFDDCTSPLTIRYTQTHPWSDEATPLKYAEVTPGHNYLLSYLRPNWLFTGTETIALGEMPLDRYPLVTTASTTLQSFLEPALFASLFDSDGYPTTQLRTYVFQLQHQEVGLAQNAVWNSTFWDNENVTVYRIPIPWV